MAQVFITVKNVYNVYSGRRRAVRNYIFINQRIYDEFKEFQRTNLGRRNDFQALKDICGDLDVFADFAGIRFVKEIGRRIVEDEDGHIQVDIDYELEYPS